ncbi:MAG TPA: hypothetical protein VFS76_06195 [Pyrinomonadaceae bacterium]|nr:hypothetical protein [Pyrinomonadaceae bacterium]
MAQEAQQETASDLILRAISAAKTIPCHLSLQVDAPFYAATALVQIARRNGINRRLMPGRPRKRHRLKKNWEVTFKGAGTI